MIVRRLKLEGFFGHEKTDLELPEHGLIVIEGRNGAGKSALLEAVAVACWGKTLRGAGWVGGGRTAAAVAISLGDRDLIVGRAREGKGSVALTWSFDPGEMHGEGIPATKTQQELDPIIGSFDVWRRTHVFSSADAAHFSLATDAERKRLIEEVLGLAVFDRALADCRADLKKAAEASIVAQRAVAREEARGASFEQAAKRAQEFLASAPLLGEEPEKGDPWTDALEDMLARAQRDELAARQVDYDIQAEIIVAQDRIVMWRETAKKLDARQCPTCGQMLSSRLTESVAAQFDESEKASLAELEKLKADRNATSAEIAELKEEVRTLEERRESARRRGIERRAWEQERAERARAERMVTQATQDLVGAQEALGEVQGALDVADLKVRELEAVDEVLGLRGPRSQILAGALAAIEAAANAWLARLGRADLLVRLAPQREAKSRMGAINEIALEVEGAGGGAYKGASAGERRRVDVALLIGLGEVAAGAAGGRWGTLFFDEVFDCLDADGREAAASALEELAQERCVVLVTHSEELARALPGAMRVRVEDGVIT